MNPELQPPGPGADPGADQTAALLQLVAAAADLCRRPLRHGVVPRGPVSASDCCLQLESRDGDGNRQPEQDLELELFRSGDAGAGGGSTLHLTLAWTADDQRPMLWHGQHPVWMDAQGQRCPRPSGGEPLEALARRLRALLDGSP